MRHVTSGGLVAAALGTALIVAGAFPAAAQVARPQSALASGGDNNSGLLTLVQDRRGGGGGGGRAERGAGGAMRADRAGRGDNIGMRASRNDSVRVARADRSDARHDRRWDRRHWRWRHRYAWRHRYPYWGSGFGIGVAAAAPFYAAPYADSDAVAYCMSRFRSYDPASGTYLGYDGLRHPCP